VKTAVFSRLFPLMFNGVSSENQHRKAWKNRTFYSQLSNHPQVEKKMINELGFFEINAVYQLFIV
jgi:hypothetical protein